MSHFFCLVLCTCETKESESCCACAQCEVSCDWSRLSSEDWFCVVISVDVLVVHRPFEVRHV